MLSLPQSPLPCGLRCSLAKDCNIFKVGSEKCIIGQSGPGLEHTDSGVEVYVDTNNEPTCREGWSMFEKGSNWKGSIDLI